MNVLKYVANLFFFRNGDNQYAYVLASGKEAKNEFRRFMARYPDMFDYARAQVFNISSVSHSKFSLYL